MRYRWVQIEYTYDCWGKGWDNGFVRPARCAGGGERDRTGGVGGDCSDCDQEGGERDKLCATYHCYYDWRFEQE